MEDCLNGEMEHEASSKTMNDRLARFLEDLSPLWRCSYKVALSTCAYLMVLTRSLMDRGHSEILCLALPWLHFPAQTIPAESGLCIYFRWLNEMDVMKEWVWICALYSDIVFSFMCISDIEICVCYSYGLRFVYLDITSVIFCRRQIAWLVSFMQIRRTRITKANWLKKTYQILRLA